MTRRKSDTQQNSGESEPIRALASTKESRHDAMSLFTPSALARPQASLGVANPVTAGRLLHRKRLIFTISVLVAAAAIPPIWLFMVPQYRASGHIRVSPVVSRIVFKTEDNSMVPLYRSYLNTQVSIIRGPKVLQRVLDRKDVQETKWYKGYRVPRFGAALTPIERLRGSLSVRPQRNTELIEVAVLGKDAGDAKILTDAVIEEYRRFNEELVQRGDVRRLETLTNEATALQHEIDGLVATKFNLSKLVGTTDPEQLRSQMSLQLSTLEAEKAGLSRALAMGRWDLQSLMDRSKQPRGDGGTATSGGGETEAEHRYARDTEWRRLRINSENTRHQLELARQRYGESHPRIAELVADIAHAETLLAARERQIEDGNVGSEETDGAFTNRAIAIGNRVLDQNALQWQIDRLSREIEIRDQEIKAQKDKVTDAGEVAKKIADYDERIRFTSDLYETVRSRLKQLDLESNAPARITVAAYAVAPSRPYSDRRIVFTAMALIGALILGFSAAFVRVATDSTIHEASEIRDAVRAPFLGQIPEVSTFEGLLEESNPLVLECIRIVRTAMLERLDWPRQNVALVTSSSSRAGKTSVSVLLARSLAQMGKKTLLVEADLYRPSLSQRVGQTFSTGLAMLLAGQIEESDAIEHSDITNLDLLPAGDRPENFSVEMLANGIFGACIQRWRDAYDFVIIDSPPMMPIADARIMARHADGAIMVLRAAHCRRRDVLQSCADLVAGGTVLLGTVLVGVSTKTGYGYYSDYSYPGSITKSSTS